MFLFIDRLRIDKLVLEREQGRDLGVSIKSPHRERAKEVYPQVSRNAHLSLKHIYSLFYIFQ